MLAKQSAIRDIDPGKWQLPLLPSLVVSTKLPLLLETPVIIPLTKVLRVIEVPSAFTAQAALGSAPAASRL